MAMQYEEFFLRHPAQDNYRLLRVYAWYRAVLASMLLALFVIDATASVLGRSYPNLYGYTISIYALISAVLLISVLLVKKEPVSLGIFSRSVWSILSFSPSLCTAVVAWLPV